MDPAVPLATELPAAVPAGAEPAGPLPPGVDPLPLPPEGGAVVTGPVTPPDVGDLVHAAVQADVPVGPSRTSSSGLTVFSDPTIPVASSSAADVGGDPLQQLALAVVEAAQDALAALARLWSAPPSPGIGARAPDGTVEPSEAVDLLQTSLSWYTAGIAVLAVLLAAGRMAWQRRAEPAGDLLRGLFTLVLVTGAGVTAVTLLVGAADALSLWVLDRATGDVEAGFVDLLALPEDGGMPVVLTILLGSAVLLGAVLQIVLVIARGAVLVVLTGVLPLTASATATDTGRAVFVRTITWIVAFVLYQPVAAMIYATAFLVAPDPDASPVVAALTGTTFLALALAALPALLRLLRPVLVAVATPSRGSHAAGRLPTGARAVAPVTLAGGAHVLRGGGPTYAHPAGRGAAGAPAVRGALLTTGSGPATDRVGRVDRAAPRRTVLELPGQTPDATATECRADEARPVPAPRPSGEDVPQ